MTSAAPPTEFFPGINFNPSFYNLGQSAVTLDYLNSNYSLELNKDNYKIINDNNWKTSNKIIDHDNPTELQLKNRKKALKSLNKKKEELGKDEFNKQRNEYMKNYRNLIFTQSRD